MVDVVARTAIGWFVLLLCNGSLAYSAHLLVRHFFSDVPCAVRWALTGLILVALVLGVTQALSVGSLYNRPAVVLTTLMVASATHWFLGRERNLEAEVHPLKVWIAALVNSRAAVLSCAALLSVFLAAARGLGSPPLEWDSLTYHLFLAARYVQLQTLAGFDGPPMMDHYAHFPMNGEIMVAWLLLPFGSDLLVSLLGFFFLALGAVAVYGLCREVGVGWEDASLATCLVCFSPFLFAYVTTQGVDIQVFAALMCGSLFVLRYLLYRRDREAVAGLLAIGIAVGTKHTALALGVILLALLVFGVFVHHRDRRDWASMAAILGGGLLLAGIVGGRSYLINWRQTGNPIYPLEVTIAGHQILAGSSYTQMIAEGKDNGSRRDDLAQFANVFNYFPTWRLPTSGGPKFLLLVTLALGGVAASGGNRPRWPVRLLAGCGLLGVLAFYLPGDGFPALARRIWPGAAARFLASPLSLLTVAAMPTIARLRGRCAALPAVLAGFALWDMFVANNFVSATFPLAVGLGTAVALPAALVTARSGWLTRHSPRLLVAMAVVAGLVAVCLLQVIRDGNRWIRYSDSTDVSWIPRDFVDGWRYCDQPERPLRIALTAGWEYRGQNWFFYPLLGRRLQNTVVYVPADHQYPPVQPESEKLRDADASRTWLQSLRRESIDAVFMEKPWPIEEAWIRESPDNFALLKGNDSFKIYRVLRE